jgi:hypothetical protein
MRVSSTHAESPFTFVNGTHSGEAILAANLSASWCDANLIRKRKPKKVRMKPRRLSHLALFSARFDVCTSLEKTGKKF